MKTLNLTQGSPEWLAHRRTTRNASDAPAMMGVSPYVTRAQLVRQRATGVEREVDSATQARFFRGHEVEPALRALAEAMLGEDLYAVTGVSDDGYLGASLDGVTLAEDVILEVKQPNAGKVACMQRDEIPPQDYWQIVQQFAVCDGAARCLYLVGDGTEAGTTRLWIDRARIEHDIPKLLAGWQQFDVDVEAYRPADVIDPVAPGRAPEQLPSLSIQVTGMVTASNLADFKAQAMAVLGGINRELRTDDDFANAEKTVTWCKGVEDRLEATKQAVLGQTADIDAVFRTMDEVAAETRRVRLELDKLVTREKEARRTAIVTDGAAAVRAHFDALNATLGQHRIQPPQSLTLDLGQAIKGKRSLASMADAVDGVVTRHKVDANQTVERVRANIAILVENEQHAALFADRVQLVATKQPEDLKNLVAARIADHQQREAERLEAERERIRKEEAERLEQEQAKREADARREQEEADRARQAAEAPPPAPAAAPAASTPAASPGAGWAKGAKASPPPADSAPAAALAPVAQRFKLGDLNAWIAPLQINADGLAKLGVQPVATQGAAKLYSHADLKRICGAMAETIANVPLLAAEALDAAA